MKAASLLWAPLDAPEMPFPHHYLPDAWNPPSEVPFVA